jgi:hypothetical protein
VVLVGDRRPEQRHDAIARVLVDRPLIAVDPLRQDLEEAIHQAVPLLGVHLLGQLHRALDVRKQHRHLLALALEGGLGLEDLVREVAWRVVAGGTLWRSRSSASTQRLAAAVAEGGVGRVGALASGTDESEGTTAAGAEGGVFRILPLAMYAGHAARLLCAVLPVYQVYQVYQVYGSTGPRFSWILTRPKRAEIGRTLRRSREGKK